MSSQIPSLISADTHLVEPPDIWTRWLPKKYQSQAPQLVKDADGGDAWLYQKGGVPEPLGGVCVVGQRKEDIRWTGVRFGYEIHPACHDGKARLEAMDHDGVFAEVVYPPFRGLGAFVTSEDPDFHLAGVHAYNQWLMEDFCAADPSRLAGAYVIPNLGVETAVAEVRRAKELGFRLVVLGMTPSGNPIIGPDDDPFWEVCEALSMPVSIHFRFAFQKRLAGGFADMAGMVETRRLLANFEVATADIQDIMLQMVFTGVFDRFPGLRMAAVEVGVGWIPHFWENVDDKYWRNRAHTGIELEKLPSEYWRDNWLATFVTDRVGVALRHAVGVENMAWSTDFPHYVNSWPYSRQLLDQHFLNVPREERHKITCANAAKLYGLRDPVAASGA